LSGRGANVEKMLMIMPGNSRWDLIQHLKG